MKRIMFGLMAGLGAFGFQTARGQADPSINLFATTPSVAVGSTSNILVQMCNNGPSTAIVANKLRPVISTGSSAIQIVGLTETNGTPLQNFTIQNLTANNVRVLYTQPLPVLGCVSFYIVVQGITPSTGVGEPFATTLGFNGPQPAGNNLGNDGSATTMLVTTPLPVHLTAFSGKASGCAATLNWKTATEQNNDYYEVEYSNDGQSFSAVGRVKSKNSATGSEYSYGFNSLVGTANYFRLKIVDLSGTFAYSSVINLTGNCKGISSITVSPNPTHDVLTVRGLGDSGATVSILDMAGREVSRVMAVSNVQVVPMSELANGVYILRVSNAQGAISNTRVVKQ